MFSPFIAAQRARLTVDDDLRDLVDLYYLDPLANAAHHAYHVVAAFVLAGKEPPPTGAFTGAEAALIAAHYEKYRPNGVDDDGLSGVGPLEAKR